MIGFWWPVFRTACASGCLSSDPRGSLGEVWVIVLNYSPCLEARRWTLLLFNFCRFILCFSVKALCFNIVHTHSCHHPVFVLLPVSFLSLVLVYIYRYFKCVAVRLCFVSCSLPSHLAHWNCIVFPGGERHCGVHELICVRKGRADQSRGGVWPLTPPHQTLTLCLHR